MRITKRLTTRPLEGAARRSPLYAAPRLAQQGRRRGFYFGFANEGLWPLCHIAHTRPVFRSEDWDHYQAVNRKFAAALLDEMSGESSPSFWCRTIILRCCHG